MMGRTPTRSDNTRYYEILGVAKDATQEDVKDAWLKAARTNHPDRGGHAEKFIELNRAYKVLSDPTKRSIYDKFGEDALDEGIASCSDPAADMLGSLFGGGSPFCDLGPSTDGSGRGRRLRRGNDVTHPLKVTGGDLESGTTKLFRLLRNVICSKCKGKGSKSGASVTCAGCQGSGKVVFSILQLCPGPSWRMLRTCHECDGTGEAISRSDRCPKCKGERVVLEKKVLEIHLEKGMPEGHEITFPGEANEAPNTITGDIVFKLELLSNED